jgi:hypothetical protein
MIQDLVGAWAENTTNQIVPFDGFLPNSTFLIMLSHSKINSK